MMIVEAALIFFVLVLVLVVSHELGHFLVAKWYGVKVEEFGVGMPLPFIPSRILKKQIGETTYSWYLLPLGGFVRIFGEDEDAQDPRSFSSQSLWARTMIVGAGVAANILVGYVVFFVLAAYGTPQLGVIIEEVVIGAPAAEAGFRSGDVVLGVGEKVDEIPTLDEVFNYIEAHKGNEALFTVMRENREERIHVVPRVEPPAGQGPLGVRLAIGEVGYERVPWYRVPVDAFSRTIKSIGLLFYGLFLLIQQLFAPSGIVGEVLGPVGIAGIAQKSLEIGVRSFFELLAFLSLNLAVVNMLPIPALDGGRILFFAIERMKGSPIPTRISHVVHSVFFLLLIGLLLVVTYQDIARLVAHSV